MSGKEYIRPCFIELETVGEPEIEPNTGGIVCQVLQNPKDRTTRDWAFLTYPPGAISSQRLVDGKYSKEIWLSGPMEITRRRGRRTETFKYPGNITNVVHLKVGDYIQIRNSGDKVAWSLEEVSPAFNLMPDRYENNVIL